MEGIRRVFAVITNGYSDAKLTTDQDVVEAVFTMTASDDVDTVFVAREDSSVSNQRGTHTNTELWIQMFYFVVSGKVPAVLLKVVPDIGHFRVGQFRFSLYLNRFLIHKRLLTCSKDLFD